MLGRAPSLAVAVAEVVLHRIVREPPAVRRHVLLAVRRHVHPAVRASLLAVVAIPHHEYPLAEDATTGVILADERL